MPEVASALEGLKPLEAIASQFYLRPAEVRAVCEEAGLRTLTIIVSRKRVDLVDEREAYRAITRHLIGNQPPAQGDSNGYVPLVDQIREQAEQLTELRRHVQVIEDFFLRANPKGLSDGPPGGGK
jgi:hypothetical protein